jgi:hypothetical protein
MSRVSFDIGARRILLDPIFGPTPEKKKQKGWKKTLII